MVAKPLLCVPLFVFLFTLACGGDDGQTEGRGDTLDDCPSAEAATESQGGTPEDLDDFADRMAAALSCPRHVAHIEATAVITLSDVKFVGAYEHWIDVQRNLGRSEEGPTTSIEGLTEDARRWLESHSDEFSAPSESDVTIISADGRYRSSLDGKRAERVGMPDCLEEELAALSLLLDCIDLGYDTEVTVKDGLTYDGRDAQAILAKHGDPEAGDRYWSTFSFYVDAESFVPLGSSSEVVSPATLDDPIPVESSANFAYSLDFVYAESLASDFFHPESIGGYEEPDPLATAYAIVAPVYWLGEEFSTEGPFRSLTLVQAFPASPELADTFPAIMTYRPSGAAPEFDVTVSTYPSLEAGAGHRPQASACLQMREVDIPGIQGTISSLPPLPDAPIEDEEPCRPPGDYFADITIDGVAVKITTFTYESDNPYNSEAGMELLIRSLVRRE
jgi:hypothetical protein